MPRTVEPASLTQLRERVLRLETEMATHRKELDVQFVRISELQVEVDALQARRAPRRKRPK